MRDSNPPIPDRVKLPITWDVDGIVPEVEALCTDAFEYYSVMPLRSPAHLVDPSLPPPPPASDYADGSWTPWLNTPALDQSPNLQSIVERFQQHTDVTLVRLLRLAAGSVVQEHRDPTLGIEVEQSVIRLTVPIISGPHVHFYLNDTRVPMAPGECWYLRLSDPHRIDNASPNERINLTLDMVPNDWVRAQLVAAS